MADAQARQSPSNSIAEALPAEPAKAPISVPKAVRWTTALHKMVEQKLEDVGSSHKKGAWPLWSEIKAAVLKEVRTLAVQQGDKSPHLTAAVPASASVDFESVLHNRYNSMRLKALNMVNVHETMRKIDDEDLVAIIATANAQMFASRQCAGVPHYLPDFVRLLLWLDTGNELLESILVPIHNAMHELRQDTVAALADGGEAGGDGGARLQLNKAIPRLQQAIDAWWKEKESELFTTMCVHLRSILRAAVTPPRASPASRRVRIVGQVVSYRDDLEDDEDVWTEMKFEEGQSCVHQWMDWLDSCEVDSRLESCDSAVKNRLRLLLNDVRRVISMAQHGQINGIEEEKKKLPRPLFGTHDGDYLLDLARQTIRYVGGYAVCAVRRRLAKDTDSNRAVLMKLMTRDRRDGDNADVSLFKVNALDRFGGLLIVEEKVDEL